MQVYVNTPFSVGAASLVFLESIRLVMFAQQLCAAPPAG